MIGADLIKISAALVWPALIAVFAAIFVGLWRSDQSRTHLLAFGIGFFLLFLAMTFHIAFVPWNTDAAVAVTHMLSALSIVAIVWGACHRLAQRVPIMPMVLVSLLSALLLYTALATGKESVALSVQNASVGLLFGAGAITLWNARPSSLLDRVLIWTMSGIAAVGLIRPALLIMLDADVAKLVHRQSDFNVVGLILMTVLTVVLGLCLVAIALQEVRDIRHGAKDIDAVSGFLNAAAFERSCEGSMATARNLGIPVCLVAIQMDWFERINTKWGAESSDGVLRQVADVFRRWQRDGDLIGRIGEDRLGILLIGAGAKTGLRAIENLHKAVDRSCNEGFGGQMKFTLSISLVEAGTSTTFTQLFVRATRPLEDARARGGNLVFVEGCEVPNVTLSPPGSGSIGTHG